MVDFFRKHIGLFSPGSDSGDVDIYCGVFVINSVSLSFCKYSDPENKSSSSDILNTYLQQSGI